MTPLDHTPCDCGDDGPRCVFCHTPLCCGPDIAACDARDHCDDGMCRSECPLCVSMARDDRRF
jgi:hypothetical protein